MQVNVSPDGSVMTFAFTKGRYGVRVATSGADVRACQALRHRCFFGGPGRDADRFDGLCSHVMIAGDAGLVGTFRVMLLRDGADIGQTYAAQSYDLGGLAAFGAPMLEMGRFCIDPAAHGADILRLAWGALAQIVDDHGVALMFGCSSFEGVDPAPYGAAFGMLAARFQAPRRWAPAVAAPEVVTLQSAQTAGALAQMPPLLRTYLSMGGWVSDHAVVDRHMQTLHVFTGLEIARIPPVRAAALRALAGASGGDI